MADYIDFRTLTVVLAAKCFFQALGLGYVWYVHRKFGPAREWALGSVCVALGTLLVALYPESESAINIVGRNFLIYIGMLIIAAGLIQTCGKQAPWRFFTVLVVAALCADAWYTLRFPSISARVVVFSGVLAIGEIYVAVVALNAPPGPLRGTQRLIAALLLLQATASILRGIGGARTEYATVFQSLPSQAVFLVSAVAVAFLMSLLLAVLTSQHMNALLAATIEHLNQGVAMFDAEQRLIVCNDRYGSLYGLRPDQVKPGTSLRAIVKQRMEKGLFSGNPTDYYRERTAPATEASANFHQLNDGRSIAVSRRPMRGGGWVTTHDDITALRRIESQLAYMAHHDTLTGLANRAVFLERIEQGFARLQSHGEDFCVLMLDLDRFKAVNDSFGHPIGDSLLKAAAFRLRFCVRATDTIARLGGDEFAIIRTDVAGRRDEVSALAERILRSISAPYDLDGRKVAVGTSIGIAMAPGDAANADQLMQKADLALYRAKSEGRNGYRFYTAEMDAAARDRAAIEASLRKPGLHEDFALRYEPLVGGRSRQVAAAVAGVFWRGPEGACTRRAETVVIAEECGRAAELCDWMVTQACADAAAWPQDVKVAVDVPRSQCLGSGFATLVARALAQSGLAADRLILRISDPDIEEDPAARLSVLQDLKRRGISLTLADFGSGARSLRQLLSFPYDYVAVGEEFVAEIARRGDAATVVAALTGLAASVGATILAEDVASEEQFEILSAAGCSQFRGPLFGPACAPAELGRAATVAKVA